MVSSVSELPRRQSRPEAKRGRLRVLLFPLIVDYSPKKTEKSLYFPRQGVNCFLESGSFFTESGIHVHFIGYFSKRRCKPTKLNYCSFAQECEMPQQGPLCLRVLLDVSLSFLERVLGRTYIFAYGDASGFFVSGSFPSVQHLTLLPPTKKYQENLT